MTVKRFVGATTKDCIRRAKAEFGPDFVLLSNKPVANGVEIVAMSPESLDALSTPADAGSSGAESSQAPIIRPLSADADDDYKVTLSAGSRPPPTVRPWTPYTATPAVQSPPANPPEGTQAQIPRPSRPVQSSPTAPQSQPATASAEVTPRLRPLPPKSALELDVLSAPQVAASLQSVVKNAGHPSSVKLGDPNAAVDGLMDEMRVIKSLLERQLSGFAWGEMAREQPTRALLLGEMIEAGFSGQLARRLAQEMPEGLSLDDGRKWLKAAVNRRLRTLPTESDFIDRGGVYALVGPTGVGKTTTTAKLAARCVVRYGADRLALLTTDGYRIGAQEQLRIYGRILGVPVFVVRDGDDLRRTLADLRDKHMVLIDTVGMSQRDRMVAEQAAMLTRNGDVNRLLLLNAGSRGDTLDDVIRAYAGEDLAGCILTKTDEASALAPALDCIVRHGLSLSYVANGQRVPEDLHLPNRSYLLHRAFKTGASDSAHHLRPEELAMSLSPSRSAASAGTSHA